MIFLSSPPVIASEVSVILSGAKNLGSLPAHFFTPEGPTGPVAIPTPSNAAETLG